MASLMDNSLIDKCIEMYRKGITLREVSSKYHVNREILTDIMLYKGVSLRKGRTCSGISNEQVKESISLYNSGMSIRSVSKRVGVNSHFLSYILWDAGTVVRKDGRKYTDNYTMFDCIDNEVSAYVLGFFYADANISCNNNRYVIDISLAIKDQDHLCKIRDLVSTQRRVTTRMMKCNGKLYEACRLSINSKVMVNALIKLGCVPRKSMILRFPTENQVSTRFQHHFMRGYFDGDGCITCPSNPGFSVEGTAEFLDSYCNVLARTGITRPTITKPSGAHCIRKGGRNQLRMIHKFLYNDSHIHLERKKVIFDLIVNNCPCIE